MDMVAGFLFHVDGNGIWWVALINKLKPSWMKGLWNGIGGKIEKGETPLQAMKREVLEEAGVSIENWNEFCLYKHGPENTIHFFWAKSETDTVGTLPVLVKTTEEVVEWHLLGDMPSNTVENLSWLIPMAQHAMREPIKVAVQNDKAPE
jgi:8-oxo-dGTP diphosphatase